MDNSNFLERFIPIVSHATSADMFNANPIGTVINMKGKRKAVFLVNVKTGGTNTGTGRMKIAATSSVAGSNAEFIPFRYAKKTTGASDQYAASAVAVAANGVVSTANEDTVFALEVDARDLPDDKSYIQLQFTEVVNDPVLGSALCLVEDSRHGASHSTILT